MEYHQYEYKDGLDNVTDSSLESEYSHLFYYDHCPELTIEDAKHYIENYTPVYSQAEKIYVRICLPILLCTGLVGNLLFLYVVCSMPTMRTATNWILANLALADMVFLSFAIGDKLWMYNHSPFINDRFSYGEYGCPVIFAFIDASYFAAIFMVTVVSLERYYAVRSIRNARSNTRKSLFIALVVISWILSIGISASFVPASNKKYIGCRVWPDVEPYKDLPMYRGTCVPSQGLGRYPLYVNITRTVPFFLLVTLNLWLYVSIVRSVTRAVHRTRFAGRADSNLKQRNQIAVMLVINGLVFFIFLVPFEIFSILQAVNMILNEPLYKQNIMVPLRHVAQVMSYINNVINPVIYIGMSQRYRDAFKNAILCRRRDDSTIDTRSCPSTRTELRSHDQSYIPIDTKL